MNFLTYEKGRAVRAEQREKALSEYPPKHSDKEYVDFLERSTALSIEENGYQTLDNFPKYYTLFTVESQHVQGNCVRECLDVAIQKAARE